MLALATATGRGNSERALAQRGSGVVRQADIGTGVPHLMVHGITIIIVHRISHGTNVVVVNDQSANNKKKITAILLDAHNNNIRSAFCGIFCGLC